MKSFLRLLPPLVLLLAALRLPAAPMSESNAVWLTRSNVTTPDHVAMVPEMASRLQDLQVRYLFLNSATLNRQGLTDVKSAQLVPFLDALGRWERANNYKFIVLVWLTGTLEPSSARYLDISDPALRGAVATEAGRYLDSKAEGSLIAGCTRPTDGILLDLQPIGGNSGVLKSYALLLDEVKQVSARAQKVAASVHKLGNQSAWQLSESSYHQLAQHADYLVAWTYNSGQKTSDDYRAWIERQTTDILRSVSGVAWKNNAHYPAPKNGVKVFIGFPAFPADKKNHLEGAEPIAAAAAGAKTALASLDALSRSYFEGAAIHALSNGEADDGYAKWATDFEEFRSAWLAP